MITVEVLCLATCPTEDCKATVAEAKAALRELGLDWVVEMKVGQSSEKAAWLQLTSSPTIRVDGADLFFDGLRLQSEADCRIYSRPALKQAFLRRMLLGLLGGWKGDRESRRCGWRRFGEISCEMTEWTEKPQKATSGQRKKVTTVKTRFTGVCVISMVLWGSAGISATIQDLPSAEERAGEMIMLKIEGWTCGSCARYVRRALLAVPGVKGVEVSYARGGAIVTVEPGRVTAEQLVQAVETASARILFRATVISNGSLLAEDTAEQSGSGLERLLR